VRFHLYIFLFLITPLLGVAQQSFTRILTTNDGLPSNFINCLYQDSVGRLWIGTDAGIGVYDGLNFAIVTSKDGLASNDVRSITQDEEGNFWLACYDGGVTKFDGKVFTRLTVRHELRSGNIRRVFYSKNFKTLFLGADEGFYTYHNGKIAFYGKANGKLKEEHEVLGFLEGKGFVYVFPYKDYRLKFYPATGVIEQPVDGLLEKSPFWSITSAIVTNKHDTIWGNKFRVSSSAGQKTYKPAKGGLVFNLSEDLKGNIWVPVWSSMDKGVLRFTGNEFVDCTSQFGLDNVGCNAVLYDRNSNILWIGTDGKGLVAVPQEVFSYYPTKSITGSANFVKQFKYKGVLHLLIKDRIVRFHPDGHSETIPITILEKSDAGNLIRKIKRDREQNLPITNGELWRLPEFYDATTDPEGNLWVSTTVGFYRLSADMTSVAKALPLDIRYGRIAFDDQGTLYNWGNWLSNLDVIPDPASKGSADKIQRYSKENATLPKDITQMVPIGLRMLFSSLHGGLYLFDGKTFSHLNKSCPELPDNISDVSLDQKGNIVYCTNTGKVGVGSFEGGRFVLHHQFDSLDQSFGRNFGWVISDKHYNIYLGTNRGMLVIHYPEVYSSQATSVRFYSVNEGYKDFGVTSPVMDDDGVLWLGSQENLLRIDTKTLSDQSHVIQKVELTGFVATLTNYNFLNDLDRHEKKRGIAYWRIPYRLNSLTFQFNCINLLNPEKDRFSIKLEGFDQDFRDVGGDRKAVYTNLPAGKYRFIVRVNNLNTLHKQEKVLLEFTISPPYWQTWWFYVLISGVLFAAVVVFYYVREKRIRRKAQTDLQIAELEMQSLQAQMNPHFVFNVINSIQRYILERDAKKGTELLGDFSRMIRQTFTLSSKRIITLQEEIAYLVSYLKLEQERVAYKFQFNIETEHGLNPADIHIPSMLIQPIVENAIKHGLSPLEGSDGLLTITFTKVDDHSLHCVVEDNGIGIEQSLAAKRDSTTRLSKALNITQRRIELLNQASKGETYSVTVTDRSKFDSAQMGTVVMIVLPVQGD
jgi:ligand-binding sensor domain-containing protein/anti-sigma regulatory factor (Ser/Thr protein kinase)